MLTRDAPIDPVTNHDADPEAVARSICLSQLDRAPRTRGQLVEVLRKRLVPDDAAERVLDRLAEVGLIDDEAFAFAWVESRHRSKGISAFALARELRSRGVADDTVASAVGQLEAEIELDTARELARRRQRTMGSLDTAAQQRRLVALLGRKGYSAGVAYLVVRDVLQAAQLGDRDELVPGDDEATGG